MRYRSLYATLFAAALAVLAPSCINQLTEAPGQLKAPASFTATMGDSDATKTTLAEDKTTVLWQPNDSINVFYSGFSMGKYTNHAEANEPIALFVGEVTSFVGATEANGINKSYWAVYPYASGNSSDGNSVTAIIPDVQDPVPANFAKGSLVTVAKSETTALQFYHVCGGIKFCLANDGIHQIVLEGNNEEVIAGKATVTMDENGRPLVTSVSDPKTTITMLTPYRDTFEPGVWYYLSCLPVEFTNGFTITLRSETATGVYTYSDPVTVKRAVWGTLTDIDEGVNYESMINRLYDKGVNEIRYTNYSGTVSELAYPANVDANLVSNTYENGQGLMVFDGPITSVGQLFDSNTARTITSIELPNGVLVLNEKFMSDGMNLGSFDIPKTVTSICNYAFYKCGFKTIDLPDKLVFLGSNVFAGCIYLKTITIPEGIESIESSTFSSCDKLESVNFPEGLVSIKDYAFFACEKLGNISLPEGITSIGSSAFSACNMEGVVHIPTTVTSLGRNAFGSNPGISGFSGPFASADGRCLIGTDGDLLGFATADLPATYTFPASVTSIKSGAISSKVEGTLIIPSTVQLLGENGIGADVHTLSISNATTIQEGAIYNNGHCSVFQGDYVSPDSMLLVSDGIVIKATKNLNDTGSGANYTIPAGFTRVGKHAFYANQALKTITIPSGITSIGANSFTGCENLTSVTLPDTLESIEDFAFIACTSLSSITIPASIKSIGIGAFETSNNLQSVTVLSSTPPSIGIFAFTVFYNNTKTSPNIYVPAESVDAYKSADGWISYAAKIQAIP